MRLDLSVWEVATEVNWKGCSFLAAEQSKLVCTASRIVRPATSKQQMTDQRTARDCKGHRWVRLSKAAAGAGMRTEHNCE